jgi:hypothetical protein
MITKVGGRELGTGVEDVPFSALIVDSCRGIGSRMKKEQCGNSEGSRSESCSAE